MVYFVGAGPGAKDLITVRGMRLLEQADVIIYAGSLVNPELLSYAGSGAKIYDSAKMTLEEVLAVIREAEEKGLTTVRLHMELLGEEAVRILEEHIASGREIGLKIIVPARLIVRGSTGRVK